MTARLRRLAPRTLRGRLSLAALTTAALLMTVLTVVFNVMMDRHLRHQADDELRDRAAAVASTVDTRGPRVHVLDTPDDEVLDANVWVYDGRSLIEKPPSATSGGTLTQAAGQLTGDRRQLCETAGTQGRPVRLCSQHLVADQAVTVVTALDLAPYRGSARTLLLGSLILDASMLVCMYALTRLSIGRALRPVQTMTDQAAQPGAVASAERFGTADHPAELARLGASLDSLLDRIRGALRHERQLTGELSHELRTPLTRIVMELDWWRARPRTDAETRATHEVIAEAARSMRTICDTLLNEARENTRNPAAVRTSTEVARVLERLLRDVDRPGGPKTALETDATAASVGVGSPLLERIVSPLLANAVRYARSCVTVSVRSAPGAVTIHITDDGPGVPPAFLPDLFQPGRRADSADGHDGAGLGLPLARRLARAVDGEVTHDPAHTPGARFTVSLPAG
ncbi:HAMP domain-containing sensor histidine kinase [Streptomyces sp. V3I7]|uniref:sensor histidine kinase n=1 Tax=Streptomyces sp. V3I7 TaxID=3042278 RepID=UPI002783DEDF|nr:HAMP domain-containing sensor histidine kinase [Streptomyces sp. V3I7]MDQ0993562.1 two-component system heavy metal sensor histidine kinase CusS [Streptomyces sp. V3I7]